MEECATFRDREEKVRSEVERWIRSVQLRNGHYQRAERACDALHVISLHYDGHCRALVTIIIEPDGTNVATCMEIPKPRVWPGTGKQMIEFFNKLPKK